MLHNIRQHQWCVRVCVYIMILNIMNIQSNIRPFSLLQDDTYHVTKITREESVNQKTWDWRILVNRNRCFQQGSSMYYHGKQHGFFCDKKKVLRKRVWPMNHCLKMKFSRDRQCRVRTTRRRKFATIIRMDTYLIGQSPPCGSAHGY